MGLRIKTNVASLQSQRSMRRNKKQLDESMERLSSGLRINKSSDDAAGLAISENIRARVKGLDQAKRNASDGVSYLQVAEGGLNEITNIQIRMRELAVQGASDAIGESERGFLDKEFQQLRHEVTRIMEQTEFNGTKLLKPGASAIRLQVGTGASEDNTITLDFSELESLNQSLESIRSESVDDESLTLKGASSQDIDLANIFSSIDDSLGGIASYRATLGSVQSRLNSVMANIDVANENLLAAQSRIRDVDFAAETAKYTQANILTQASVSVLSQANNLPELALRLVR